jgi:hypothetical protein
MRDEHVEKTETVPLFPLMTAGLSRGVLLRRGNDRPFRLYFILSKE